MLPAARRVVADESTASRVRQVLYAPTTQAVTPAHVDPAREIRDRLGPHRAEAFGLSHQNCASGMAAVDVAGELLRAEGRPGDCALVVTGEQAFSPKIQLIEDVAIMGDAAAACPVTLDGAGDAVRSYVTSSMGEFSAMMLLEEERSPRFSEVYAPELAKVMRRAVAAAGLGGAGRALKGLRRTRVIGFHAYMGTRFLRHEDLVHNTREILAVASPLADEAGVELSLVDFGGGFGIPYFDNEPDLNIPELAAGIEATVPPPIPGVPPGLPVDQRARPLSHRRVRYLCDQGPLRQGIHGRAVRGGRRRDQPPYGRGRGGQLRQAESPYPFADRGGQLAVFRSPSAPGGAG